MFHTPAHKDVRRLTIQDRAPVARFPVVDVQYTAEEEAAFLELGGTEYVRGGFDKVQRDAEATCDRLADAPYNHRDCEVLCSFGPAGIEHQWSLFVAAVGYELGAIQWLPAGSTRRSMFAESGLSCDGKTDLGIRIVDDRICDREWDWYA